MIDEKGLVRQIKKAYSGGGLKVYRFEDQGVDRILFDSGFWSVTMPMNTAPSKALGLVAEYLRRLPLIGEAFMLQKKLDPEKLQYEGLHEKDYNSNAQGCRLLPFYLEGYAVYQTRDLEYVVVNSELLEIINDKKNMGQLTESRHLMIWIDPDENSVLTVGASPNLKAKHLARLRGQNFWKDEENA